MSLSHQQCTPCRGGIPQLSPEQEPVHDQNDYVPLHAQAALALHQIEQGLRRAGDEIELALEGEVTFAQLVLVFEAHVPPLEVGTLPQYLRLFTHLDTAHRGVLDEQRAADVTQELGVAVIGAAPALQVIGEGLDAIEHAADPLLIVIQHHRFREDVRHHLQALGARVLHRDHVVLHALVLRKNKKEHGQFGVGRIERIAQQRTQVIEKGHLLHRRHVEQHHCPIAEQDGVAVFTSTDHEGQRRQHAARFQSLEFESPTQQQGAHPYGTLVWKQFLVHATRILPMSTTRESIPRPRRSATWPASWLSTADKLLMSRAANERTGVIHFVCCIE